VGGEVVVVVCMKENGRRGRRGRSVWTATWKNIFQQTRIDARRSYVAPR